MMIPLRFTLRKQLNGTDFGICTYFSIYSSQKMKEKVTADLFPDITSFRPLLQQCKQQASEACLVGATLHRVINFFNCPQCKLQTACFLFLWLTRFSMLLPNPKWFNSSELKMYLKYFRQNVLNLCTNANCILCFDC